MNAQVLEKTVTTARLENLTKIYHLEGQNVVALKDINVTFKCGSFWSIMGPSGSGKSTLLNLIGCLDKPSSGSYILQGKDVSLMNDNELSFYRLRQIGFVFQSFNLISQLTVAENIELPLFYLGWNASKSEQYAVELATKVGLKDRLRHKPSQLSGGQQQRVAIARALANDPAIILADEPTGNLDTTTGEEIMTLLCELNEQGKTIIIVTHEPDIAEYTKQQMHLRDGRIERMEGVC